MEIDKGARLFNAIDPFFSSFLFLHEHLWADEVSERTSDGKSITKTEAALWWHRGSLSLLACGAIEIAQAVDRKIGPRPPQCARSPASRIIYPKTHRVFVASSRSEGRETRRPKKRADEANSIYRVYHARALSLPRGSIVRRRPDRKLLTAGLISVPLLRIA